MTCDPHTYSPRGRQGLGVVQPQSGLDYPFIAPSEDIRYLVADFYLEYDDITGAVEHPLRIKWFFHHLGCPGESIPGFTPINDADIVVVDSQDNVVFNSTASDGGVPKTFAMRAWGADYFIYEWRGRNAVCRLVVYTTWAPDEADERDYPDYMEPEAAILDERAVYKVPKRVTSLKTLLTTLRQTEVDFVSGYNFSTTTAPTSANLRVGNRIVFNAVPGAGRGKYSDCADENPAVTCINGVCGKDIVIDTKDCLWTKITGIINGNDAFVPEKTEPGSCPCNQTLASTGGALKLELRSNCPACCSCSDYVGTAQYMNSVRDVYKVVGGGAHDVLLQHSDNITRWLEQRECRIKKPIKLAMTAQRCPNVDIVVQYCNLCDECAEDVNLTVQISAYPSAGVTGYIEQCYSIVSSADVKNAPYIVDGSWPNFFINFGQVSAGNSASATFRLRTLPAGPRTITAKVTGTYKKAGVIYQIRSGCSDTDAITAAKISKPLACNPDGTTITACV